MTQMSKYTKKNVDWVITTFMNSFIAVEPKLKKSQLTLSATGDDLNLGSLDWMDVITELEGAFNITIETRGLFGSNVRKLLYACTRTLINQNRLTYAEETIIVQEYDNMVKAMNIVQKAQPASIATVVKQNTK